MLFRTSASILFLMACASAPRMSRPLSCDVDESVALQTAPSGVSRGPKDELRIGWNGGTRVFRDSGVVAGDMGGIDYRYRGYDPRGGFHLVFKHDNELFTGVLLEQATGRLLPAGQSVLFAPDEDRYLASAQPDGLDGEEWHIYSIRRGELWQGVSSIPAKDSSVSFTYYNAELTNPHWSRGRGAAGNVDLPWLAEVRAGHAPTSGRRLHVAARHCMSAGEVLSFDD